MAAAVTALAALLAVRIRAPMIAWATVAPLTLLAAHLIARHELWLTHDPARIGAFVATEAGNGVATTDRKYAGQFSFSGRLTEPVTVLARRGRRDDVVRRASGGPVLSKKPIDAPDLTLAARREVSRRRMVRLPDRTLGRDRSEGSP